MASLTAFLTSDNTIQALSWMLIHSLWQGLVLAVLAGLLVQLTHKASSGLRYTLLTGLFCLFLVAAGLTFTLQLGAVEAADQAAVSSFISTADAAVPALTTLAAERGDSSLSAAITAFCNAYSLYIVLLWFAIFAYKCSRICSGLYYISSLRQSALPPASSYWGTKVAQLAALLKIGASVRLLESALVKVPVVIGYLQPVILVPTGMLAQIPADQVEAILLHELAHIRRRDSLVNLVQCVAETIFFFNPALLWVSELIRQERESCCDDMAIGVLKDKSHFVNALVSFQEYNLALYKLSPGFAGHKPQLMNRVKRILFNSNTPLLRTEKLFLLVGLLLSCALAFTLLKPMEMPVQADQKNVLPDAKAAAALPPAALRQPAEVPHQPLFTPAAAAAKEVAGAKRCAPKVLAEGEANKSFDGTLAKYRYKKEGVVYEVALDKEEVVSLKINEQPMSAADIARYVQFFQEARHQLEQGIITIVVDSKHAKPIDAKPANPIMIGFIKNGTIGFGREEAHYEISVRDHKVVQFSIDNRAVATGAIELYRSLIEELCAEAEADRIYAELAGRALQQLQHALTEEALAQTALSLQELQAPPHTPSYPEQEPVQFPGKSRLDLSQVLYACNLNSPLQT